VLEKYTMWHFGYKTEVDHRTVSWSLWASNHHDTFLTKRHAKIVRQLSGSWNKSRPSERTSNKEPVWSFFLFSYSLLFLERTNNNTVSFDTVGFFIELMWNKIATWIDEIYPCSLRWTQSDPPSHCMLQILDSSIECLHVYFWDSLRSRIPPFLSIWISPKWTYDRKSSIKSTKTFFSLIYVQL
jgi:hypothetical protein